MDQFLDLTFSQIVGLRTAIAIRHTKKFHAEASLHASLHRATIKPLEEILPTEGKPKSAFKPDVDKKFSDYAEKMLKEKRAEHFRNGRRSKA